MARKLKAAITGTGKIGTDLMIKIQRHPINIEMGAMVAIDLVLLHEYSGCWKPELRPHFNRSGKNRSGAGVTSSSA
jgi:hypothetical protein